MLRVAWFTPLPPVRSGISQYSAELLPALAATADIDIFVDGQPRDVAQPDTRVSVRSAHDFVWMHFRRPYDVVVYQLGNAICHDYMWAYLARYPGLVVLHDGQLHLARGRSLRVQGRVEDYHHEFIYNHPGVDDGVVDLGLRGLLGPLSYLWSMCRTVVRSARMVAVHNQFLAAQLTEDSPGARIEVVEMGVPAHGASPDARHAVRQRHGIPEDAVVFVALGAITPEKRIAEVIRQLAAIPESGAGAYLLLAGRPAPHYDALADARANGVERRVIVAGFIADEEVAEYLAAADVCLCLRWMTSRETSAAWLRCLAAGRPTVITDLQHTTDIPAYDPRTWNPLHTTASETDAMGWPIRPEPACVAIDLLDEEHSLQLAMRRLASDEPLRRRLGLRARELWANRFSLDGMVARYRKLLEDAAAAPAPDAVSLGSLPDHFRKDGTEHASRILRDAGLTSDDIAALWSVPRRTT